MSKATYMEDIRRTYGVPAKRGARVEYQPENKEPWQGTVVSAKRGYLRIRKDGEKRTYPAPFHPTWNLKYLGGIN
jgi:hypothetical protein